MDEANIIWIIYSFTANDPGNDSSVLSNGSFINYVRVSRGRGTLKNLYILLLWREGVKPILA
jgi:hypothetical protein